MTRALRMAFSDGAYQTGSAVVEGEWLAWETLWFNSV